MSTPFMRTPCLLIRRPLPTQCRPYVVTLAQRRKLLALAIESSCDDTSVAILEKDDNKSTLHFHDKVTSDNRAALGIHPVIAIESHQKSLGPLLQRAMQQLPLSGTGTQNENSIPVRDKETGETTWRKRPDFVTATRGPGIYGSLHTGIDTAKGLAVAWDVPFLGVNHMQAHALTPRLVSSLKNSETGETTIRPEFPFLSLLVSGGNTMLVHTKSVLTHSILAETLDTAIGNCLDKCAIHVLPPSLLESGESVSYGPLLENFAFPNGEKDYAYKPEFTKKGQMEAKVTQYGWVVAPPFSQKGQYTMNFSYSGIRSSVTRIAEERPDMNIEERRVLAREAMRISFEHVGSRALMALATPALKATKTLVVAGGVASNQYLKYVLRSMLDARGFNDVELVFPPLQFCTDNAAMIAWTGMEMWEEGFRSSLEVVGQRKWSIDAGKPGGGILRLNGWIRREEDEQQKD